MWQADAASIIDLVPALAWAIGQDEHSVWCNRRWLAYTGQTLEQAQDDGWLDAVYVEDRSAFRRALQAAYSTGIPLREQCRIRHAASGDFRWFLLSMVPARDAHGDVTRWYGAGLEVDDLKNAQRVAMVEAMAADRVAVAAERHALLKRFVSMQEEERRRLAYEVHDGITQLAAAAALHLDDVLDLLPSAAEQVRSDLERGRDLVRQAAHESRRLIMGLRPEALDDFGLTGALRQEVETLREAGWPATFEQPRDLRERLSPEAEIMLYRVAQEALTNVRKHAGHSRVRVRLESMGEGLKLEVRDWGRGFDPSNVRPGPQGERVGLASMRERMALLGGYLEVRSGAEHGTTIRAVLPNGRG